VAAGFQFLFLIRYMSPLPRALLEKVCIEQYIVDSGAETIFEQGGKTESAKIGNAKKMSSLEFFCPKNKSSLKEWLRIQVSEGEKVAQGWPKYFQEAAAPLLSAPMIVEMTTKCKICKIWENLLSTPAGRQYSLKRHR